MPFSVFHSWLERLLVFFFLAWLALAVETAAATRHLSVREALGRRWRHPGSIPTALQPLWPPQPPSPQPLWHASSLSSSLVFPPITISPHLLRVWLTAAKKELLPSWTSEAANALFRHQPLWGCSRGCGGWQQLEAMEGESSQHHAIAIASCYIALTSYVLDTFQDFLIA